MLLFGIRQLMVLAIMSGRYKQAKSDWDVLHPGRKWADKCQGVHATPIEVKKNISTYFTKLNEE